MRPLVRRLKALEGGRVSSYDLWTDAQLIERMNEITLELRPYGLDFPMLDGGPDDVDRLHVTEKLLSMTMADLDARYPLTH